MFSTVCCPARAPAAGSEGVSSRPDCRAKSRSNLHHVGDKSQADEGVFLILVFEEDVDVGGLAVDVHLEEQIARGRGERGVDKTAAHEL